MKNPSAETLAASWFRYLLAACLLFPVIVLLLIYL
jgi:hypothetical protein